MTMYGRYYTPLSISTEQKVRLFGEKKSTTEHQLHV